MSEFTDEQNLENLTAGKNPDETYNANNANLNLGRAIQVPLGETVALWDGLRCDGADGKYYKAQGDALANADCICVAGAAGILNDAITAYTISAVLYDAGWTWDEDLPIMLSDATAGLLTQDQDQIVPVVVAWPKAATKLIVVCPAWNRAGIGNQIWATTPATVEVTAAGGVTPTYPLMRVQSDGGAVNITANPQIAAMPDGTMLILEGISDANTIEYGDGDGLQLAGGAAFVQARGDIIAFSYNSGRSLWIERYRSNN